MLFYLKFSFCLNDLCLKLVQITRKVEKITLKPIHTWKIIEFFSEKAQKQGDRGEITIKTYIHWTPEHRTKNNY